MRRRTPGIEVADQVHRAGLGRVANEVYRAQSLSGSKGGHAASRFRRTVSALRRTCSDCVSSSRYSSCQHLTQKTVADRKELRAWPLGKLPDFLGFSREPVVEQCESAISINQLLGVVMVGGDFANAQVLLQFQDNLRQIVQAAQDFLANGCAIIKVARNQPIHVFGTALFEG